MGIRKEILMKAKDAAEQAIASWDFAQEHERSDMREIYWSTFIEYEAKTKAYLDCYEIITGRYVMSLITAIERELEEIDKQH